LLWIVVGQIHNKSTTIHNNPQQIKQMEFEHMWARKS